MNTNLIISGGGFKVIRILGGLKYMEEQNSLKQIKAFYGTSAGGILCLLLCLNYSMNQIIKIFNEHFTEKLKVVNADINNFFNKYSFCDSTKFTKLIKTLIGCKLNPVNPNQYKEITLKELYEKTGKKLTCTTISLKTYKIKYLNYINQPNLPVYKLICMTSCIPLVFEPIEHEGDFYIDGGIVDNFPITAVPIHELPLTLGIGIKSPKYDCDISYGNVIEYINRIIFIAANHDLPRNLNNVVYVTIDKRLEQNMIDTEITVDERMEMIDAGYEEVKQQLKMLKPKRRKSL